MEGGNKICLGGDTGSGDKVNGDAAQGICVVVEQG